MIFTIIVVLLVALMLIVVFVNGYQQHREKLEAERRTELAKQKSIVDETEDVIVASANLPISNTLNSILQTRVINALKVMHELDPKQTSIRQRLRDAESRVKEMDVSGSSSTGDESIQLPDNDRQIIVFIQCLKKQRALLRSEHGKGKVDSHIFSKEDRRLDKLQLRVNVETLDRRAKAALKGGMMGSARQYFEKAIAAVNAFPNQDNYTADIRNKLEVQLKEIQENLTRVNAEDRAKRAEEERDELDELFAPKKKW